MVSLLKRNNCQKTLYHSRILMECFGGNAASDEYPIARIAANAHVVSTYEGELPVLPSFRFCERVLTGRADFLFFSVPYRDLNRYLRRPRASWSVFPVPTMTQLTFL